MGRMNNARRQQQNAEVINKSTRSRFSTWKPPSKQKAGKGGKGRGRGGKGRRDEAKPEARVIGGLTVRAAKKKTEKTPQSATSAALERQRRSPT